MGSIKYGIVTVIVIQTKTQAPEQCTHGNITAEVKIKTYFVYLRFSRQVFIAYAFFNLLLKTIFYSFVLFI